MNYKSVKVISRLLQVSIIFLLFSSCSSKNESIAIKGKQGFQIFAKSNPLIDSIIVDETFKTVLLGITYEDRDTLLQVIPAKNCLPKSLNKVYVFKKNGFTFVFYEKQVIQLVLGDYTLQPIDVMQCDAFERCENADCPVMLFSYEKREFKKLKGYYW